MEFIPIKYSLWAQVLNANPSWSIYHIIEGDSRQAYTGNKDYIYKTIVNIEDRTSYDALAVAKQQVDDYYEVIAYIIGIGKILETPKTLDGRPRIAIEKSITDHNNFYSHDFTDPTTWYQESTRVVDEIATPNGTYDVYTLAHSNVIDSYHGKLTGEDKLVDSQGNLYRVVVKINDVVKTEQDPHYGTGGDYTVNYEAGTITMTTALTVNDEVKVTYYYATTSGYTVKPATGKLLVMDVAEVQFSLDVNPTDSIIFDIRGIVDYFYPPAYVGNNPGQIPPGTEISLERFVYKTMSDFHNDAFKAYPTYKALGNPSNWRAQLQDITVFDWDYLSSVTLNAAYGMRIRVFLEHDTSFEGYMATATFYCSSESL